MATLAKHRKALKLHAWDVGEHMAVKHHMRDLGAHLTLSGSAVATTLSARGSRAAKALDRVRRLPVGIERKCSLIRGKA